MIEETNTKMPSYRIGVGDQWVAPGEDKFTPADGRSYFDSWYNIFDHYWTDRQKAQEFLDDIKAKVKDEAAKGKSFIKKTDEDLADRIRYGRCTQSDIQLPYYDAIYHAVDAIRHYETIASFVVGEWNEPADVYRVNTLLCDDTQNGREKVQELTEKVNYFGYCNIAWRCFGSSRAKWQTEADVGWIKANRPEWKVAISSYGDSLTVSI